MPYKNKSLSLLLIFLLCACPAAAAGERSLPDGFVYVEDVIPGVKVELRYISPHNFIGDRIDGYVEPKCILTKEAAKALGKVQEELKPFGLGLKIYDAYRPQRAVDHFVRWAKDLEDVRMKQEFYPDVDKANLFKEEYIADRSSHTRGSTVDLTIVALDPQTLMPTDAELDMGSGFDFFGPQSWPDSSAVGPAHRAHRMLLQKVMEKHGFKPYPKEWWHFTLKNEPYPETYFNFPVE